MGNLGMRVMLGLLGGDEGSVKAFSAGVGKEISSLALQDDALRFTFADGTKMRLYDDGQSCCENRHMDTDDDLSHYVGAHLQSAEVRDAPNEPDEYGEHEVAFLVVTTDKGAFTVATHNEHNGYYGGFLIRAVMED